MTQTENIIVAPRGFTHEEHTQLRSNSALVETNKDLTELEKKVAPALKSMFKVEEEPVPESPVHKKADSDDELVAPDDEHSYGKPAKVTFDEGSALDRDQEPSKS